MSRLGTTGDKAGTSPPSPSHVPYGGQRDTLMYVSLVPFGGRLTEVTRSSRPFSGRVRQMTRRLPYARPKPRQRVLGPGYGGRGE